MAESRSSRIVWHAMFWVVLLAFACRSLIPVGFMPDADALRDGHVVITFCVPNGGTSEALISLSDKSNQGSGTESILGADCPFGLMAAQAVIPPVQMAVLVAVVLPRELPRALGNTVLPPLPAQGPPVGLRAPPPNLS